MKTFPLREKIEIEFSRKGHYQILFIGGFGLTNKGNFKIQISKKSDKVIIPHKLFRIGSNRLIKFRRAINYCSFIAPTSGEYRFEFFNLEDLSLSKSRLQFIKVLSPKIHHSKIKVVIKKKMFYDILLFVIQTFVIYKRV